MGTSGRGVEFESLADDMSTMELSAGGGMRGRAQEDANPFQMPSDEQIFRMRQAEKLRVEEERRLRNQLRVHQKTTFSSRMATTNVADLLADDEGYSADGDDAVGRGMTWESKRTEKENMSDFIAKKREIFLVQMSLNTKRSEIRKLEERAQRREEALRLAETMLEKDAMRFDAFLKDNDEKNQNAIRKAEQLTRMRQEKTVEIKRLQANIAGLRSELSKLYEQLEECQKYRDFLNHLTPREHFEKCAAEKAARQAARKEKRLQGIKQARREDWERRVEEARARKAAEEERNKNARGKPIIRRGPDEEDELDVLMREDPSWAPSDDVEFPGDVSDTEPEMYFTNPQQLLDIFSELEEQNLFLIQNNQETEGELEDLKAKFSETRSKMDGEVNSLQAQIDLLNSAIAAEETRTMELMSSGEEKVPRGVTGRGKEPEKPKKLKPGQKEPKADPKDVSLDELQAKVTECYSKCGFDGDASMSILQMLSNIEARLEENLKVIDTLPHDFVAAAEKAREKERRSKIRVIKMREEKEKHEARTLKSLLRAQAPILQKTGKPLMVRGPMPSRKKKLIDTGVKLTEEEKLLNEFLARDE